MGKQEKAKVKEKKYVCVPCDYAFETWREAKSHYSTAHPHVKNTIMKRSTISAAIKQIGGSGLRGIPVAPISAEPVLVESGKVEERDLIEEKIVEQLKAIEHDKAKLRLALDKEKEVPQQPVPKEIAVKGEARLSLASKDKGKVDYKDRVVKEAIERAVSQWFDSMDAEKEIQRAMDKVVSEGKLKGSRKRFEEKLREEIAKIVDEEIMKQWIVSGKLGLILELMGASTSTSSTPKAESNWNEMLKTDLLHKIQESLKPKTYVEIAQIYLKVIHMMKPSGTVVDHEWVMTIMDFAKWLDDHKFEHE